MDSSEIIQRSRLLAQYVEMALHPDMSADERCEAYNVCEQFKESFPLNIQCSIYLASHDSDLVRNFGLQVMEHCVKFKWYDIDQCYRINIKDTAMSLLRTADSDLSLHAHLRVALSRVIIEIMKREWPQHLPMLLPELYIIACQGRTQAEIVLLILLRFIEDVAILQTVEYQTRRKDLYQNLISRQQELLTFVLNIIGHYYQSNNAPANVRIINLAVKLLGEMVEFVSASCLIAEERLLPVLCNLLNESYFQCESADCLNRIASKKGQYEERRSICKFLSNSTLLRLVSRLNLIPRNGALTENYYVFIKKMAELLASLGNTLCVVVRTETDATQDLLTTKNFILFLDILTSLCDHPSCVVAFEINSHWNQLLKHPVFGRNALVLQYAAVWAFKAAPKLMKLAYTPPPTLRSSVFQECYRYLAYDFDSNDSFAPYFYRFRVEVQDAFRSLTAVAPAVAFDCVEQWLLARIEKNSANPSLSEEDKLEWNAIGLLLDTLVYNFPLGYDVPSERGILLLDMCLNLKPIYPQELSLILACISPLFFFTTVASTQDVRDMYIARTLELTFACVVHDQAARSEEARGLRKHAACLLIRLASKYQRSILPYFDLIRTAYANIKHQLSRAEDVLLLQMMLLINMGFDDYDKQSRFIEEIFAEVRDGWRKLNENVLCDWSKLADFVGLRVCEPTEAQVEAILANRAELLHCIEVIHAVIYRSTVPKSRTFRNPCTPHILPILPGVFSLIRSMHTLWTDEVKRHLPPEYEQLHQLTKAEKEILLGIHTSPKSEDQSNAVTRVDFAHTRAYLNHVYQMCFDLLDKACHCLGASFYELPNFAPSLGASIFHTLDSIPDSRLRVMTKSFLIPFLYSCPADKHDAILIPVFTYFSYHMLKRLSNRWLHFKKCRENGSLIEDCDENCEEYVEELLNMQLSREYMDVVRTALFKVSKAHSMQNGIGGNANEESQINFNLVPVDYENLSDLGVKLLRHESSRAAIVQFLLNAITWSDSANSLKATFKISTVTRQLRSDENLTDELAAQTMIALLKGFQLHGQHDTNVGCLLNATVLVYQLVRPMHAQVAEILASLPGADAKDFQEFEKIALSTVYTTKIDKRVKELLRKLIRNIVGKNVGQLFKRTEAIRDLPKIKNLQSEVVNLNITTADGSQVANFFC